VRGDIGELAVAISRRGDDLAFTNQRRTDRDLAAPGGSLRFLKRAPHETCVVCVHSLRLDCFDKRPE
jgi:hypothetical protein